ncbi:hypothetical protein M0802_006672 [Mischocyttarus mexicanus]|nr:hypothetical protein M0802_006672 [Mischocyttarus mexicanus]
MKGMKHIEYDKHYMESKTPGPRSNHEEVTASEDPRKMLKSLRLQHSNKLFDEELFFENNHKWPLPKSILEMKTKRKQRGNSRTNERWTQPRTNTIIVAFVQGETSIVSKLTA